MTVAFAAPRRARAVERSGPRPVATRPLETGHQPGHRADFCLVPVRAISGSDAVRQRLGSGVPLPDAVRAEQEGRFGVSFAHVRVHHDSAAHRLADQHLARALTVGSDIVFNRGRFRPGTPEGRQLLAHELAHVVQQGHGPGAGAGGSAHEQAADRASMGTGPVSAGPCASVGVQCAPLSEQEIAQLTLPEVEARIADNDREVQPLVISEDYERQLGVEHVRLLRRYAQLTGPAGRRSATDSSDRVLVRIVAELAEVEPLADRLIAADPADQALSMVRAVGARLRQDQEVITAFAERNRAAQPAANRIRGLVARFDPVVARAEQWHAAHPAGRSLGMINDEALNRLAGQGVRDWERGGWYYVSGAAAFVGAGAVALLDAGESMLAMGFHEAATAVSQAYTGGLISWNDGERILASAAWRALLTAAVTRGAGAAAGRLGGATTSAVTRAAGREVPSVAAGALGGAVTGAATTAVSLGSQSVLTGLLADHFSGPAGAIWRQGMPSGDQWALAIPLGMLLGGLGGARAVRLGNERLIGSVVQTSFGPVRIVAITPNGQVVVGPVGLRTPPPPPPPAVIDTVFDPTTNSWQRPPVGGAGGVPASGADLVPAPVASVQAPRPASPVRPGPGAPAARPAPLGPVGVLPAPPQPAAQPAPPGPAGLLPAPSRPPVSTPRTVAADRRVAETRTALATANLQLDQARTILATEQANLTAARADGNPASLRQAELNLRRARNQVARLESSAAIAVAEATAVNRGRAEVLRLETRIAELEREQHLELYPPGGFTREQRRAGRTMPGVVPPIGQPAGARYHWITGELQAARRRLDIEVAGLRRSLNEQVAAATPGASARLIALTNASRLDPSLRPRNGIPVDVATGQPITTNWATDHIMSRAEIARDPRFAQLSPAQRDDILLNVPENYLPLTAEANSSKGDLTVDEWIRARAASGRPLPGPVASALRAADRIARAAIEARFRLFLSQ